MNDTTMPPPKAKKPAVPRRKTGRFGMAEWTRLLRLSKDLAQRKGQPIRRIPMDEIKQHSSVYDGWIVLRGKVYNLSPYLAYHPGGEAIFKQVLGRDATTLFDKYHRWVSEEGLIGKLLIGYLDASSLSQKPKLSPDGFAMPAPKPPRKTAAAPPLLATQGDSEEEQDVVNLWEKDNGDVK
jgi:cytochrome b involved in lipid metabolism